jgi:hypothetical protein
MRKILFFIVGALSAIYLAGRAYADLESDVIPLRGVANAFLWLNNDPHRALTTDAVWSGAKYFNLGTATTTITPNFCQYANATVTLGATGLNLVNPTCIQEGMTFSIRLVEDGTGSRTITTWGSFYKFSGGTKPTLTTTAGALDFLQCTAQPGATTGVCSVIANPS